MLAVDRALPGFGRLEKSLVLDSQPVNASDPGLATVETVKRLLVERRTPNPRVELAHDAGASETPDPSRPIPPS